jgi:Mor family transcriptional regulator
MDDILKILGSAIMGPVLVLSALFIMKFTFDIIGVNPTPVFSVVVALAPLWVPFLLFYLLYEKWMDYVRLKFAISQGRSTVRIKLPQEVLKSPEAMESVMAQIHNVNSADNLWQVYIDGKHPLMYSFELVSYGGDVRFYVNVPTKKIKNQLEAQLYAQYPGIEVVEEMIDYTAEVAWDPEQWEMMSFHMGKKDDQVFPLKTYIDFGMDKLPKEELKFEPMAAMLEQLSTYKPHERVWVQFLCKPHAKQNFKTGSLHKHDTWEHEVFEAIDKLMGRGHFKSNTLNPDEREDQPRLTTGERDKIVAMERNVGKYAYETAIRWMYVTKKGTFDGNAIAPMIRTFAQYDVLKRNGIGVRWRTDFNYNMFSDYSGKKKLRLKKKELADYKMRKYTVREAVKKIDEPKIFTVEELATMFHIPGSSVVTPGLSRIPSTRKEAPPNLPVGEMK